MPLSNEQIRSWLGRELGSLALSAVAPLRSETLLRAASWSNGLARLGVLVPPFVVHDLGVLIAVGGSDATIEPRAPIVGSLPNEWRLAHEAYVSLLREVAATEVAEKARVWRLSDELVTVLLARLLSDVWTSWRERHRRPPVDALPLQATVYESLEPQLPALFVAHERDFELRFCRHLAQNRLLLLTLVEGLDLDTLRLLGLFRSGDRMAGIVDVTDLLGVLRTPQANDIVNFSLDVIPSILETKRSSGMQTFSVDGYAGLARRGTLDSLLLSELAHDDVVFEQRYADNELFYYAHEKQSEHMRRLHYIALDASASMRGEREVFARGLALALVKKLSLAGEDVYLRFFDSQLYDLVRSRGEQFDVPYLLCFRSERGRNYGKVFHSLAVELQRIATRERRRAVLYIVTHAECHIADDVMSLLKRSAHVYGVFILPSTGTLALDYLDQLDHYQVIDRATLLDREARADKALEICDDAAGFGRGRRP
jgi:hypothetical protein